jgi:hypothetical protein
MSTSKRYVTRRETVVTVEPAQPARKAKPKPPEAVHFDLTLGKDGTATLTVQSSLQTALQCVEMLCGQTA